MSVNIDMDRFFSESFALYMTINILQCFMQKIVTKFRPRGETAKRKMFILKLKWTIYRPKLVYALFCQIITIKVKMEDMKHNMEHFCNS